MLTFVLFVSFISYTSAAVTCSIKTCDTVLCAPVTAANCAGVIKPHGGNCGCCDACITTTASSYDQGSCAIKTATIKAEQAQHFVYGKEEPRCDPLTGDFLGMQHSGSQSVCVTVDGTFISGYMVYRWMADDMDCQCARDEYSYQQTGQVGKTFNCDVKGNYPGTGV